MIISLNINVNVFLYHLVKLLKERLKIKAQSKIRCRETVGKKKKIEGRY